MLRTLLTRFVALSLALALPASASAGPLKEAAEKAARDLAATQTDQSSRSRGRLWTSIALMAGGGVLSTLGGIELGESDTGSTEVNDTDDPAGADDGDRWEKVMLGGGIAAAGAGIVLLMTGGARPSSTISARPGRVTVRHTIRF